LLANSLAKQGLHTLSVDLRGYGESVSQAYSQEDIKEKAKDIVSYQSEMALVTASWPDDLLAMYQYLIKKVDKSKGIAVVASGCSGSYAVNLAEQIQLSALVLITPTMTYADKDRYKNLVDIPSYFITSETHQASYETTQELFTWNGSSRSKLQIFKGMNFDYQLISRKKHLVNDISLWIKSNLK
jgi:esterase/lipase